jgi:uracil-DNA glycosylase
VTEEHHPGAVHFLPERRDLDSLRAAACHCRGCDLWRNATQTVFGEGAVGADLMLVGEQPGDVEDRRGRPFVGPAGRILDQALERAHIPRDQVYVTNAVKHFRWEARGKRRIHQRPTRWQVIACRDWLEAELDAVRPRVLVLMGSVAATSMFGADFRVTEERGRPKEGPFGVRTVATVHPSSILRGPPEDREAALTAFADDLAIAAALLEI